jgi:hypothetical protein
MQQPKPRHPVRLAGLGVENVAVKTQKPGKRRA